MSENTGGGSSSTGGGFVFATDDYSDSDSAVDYMEDDDDYDDEDMYAEEISYAANQTETSDPQSAASCAAAPEVTPGVAPVRPPQSFQQMAPSAVGVNTFDEPTHSGSGRTLPAFDVSPVPVLHRPEFVQINIPPQELLVTNFISDNELKLWNDFFNAKPINNEDIYLEHDGVYDAFQKLWYRGWFTITGPPGIGKTALAERLSIMLVKKPTTKIERKTYYVKSHFTNFSDWKESKMPEERTEMYQVVYVNSIEEWRRKVKKDKHQVVILDDIFGPASYTISKIEQWIPYLQEIMDFVTKNRPKTLIIITVQNFQVDKMHPRIKRFPFFQKKLIMDLSDYNKFLDTYPRDGILQNIFGKDRHGMTYSELSEARTGGTRSYPLACRLYGGVKSFHMEGPKFFQSPERSMESVVQKVFNFHKVLYYTLVCGVLFDGVLDLDKQRFEDFTESQQNIFQKLRAVLEIPEDVTLDKMRYACTLLNGVFLLPTRLHCWKFSHDRVYYCVADAINRKIPKALVELCSLDFVIQRLRTSNYFGGGIESCISVWNKDHEELYQRFTFEILKGNVRLLASHPSLSDSRFSEAWIKFMAEMGSLLPVVQQRGDYNRSLFFWAAFYGHEQTCSHLLSHEDLEDIRQEEWFKEELNLALYAACTGTQMNYGKLVKLLLEKGASLDVRETLSEEEQIILYGGEVTDVAIKWKGSLLHIASLYGSLEAVSGLIAKGADVNEKTDDGFTPLHRAASNPDDGAVRALVKGDADLKAVSVVGSRPLHEAVRCGCESATRQLHWAGDKIQESPKMNDDYRSILSVSVNHENDDLTRTVMNSMEKPTATGCRENWTPLQSACALSDEKLVKMLLDGGASVNEKGFGGWTALHFAVLFNNPSIVYMLLHKEADVNASSYYQRTPLHLAAENGYFDICNILLDNGAKPERMSSDSDLPVNSAAANGYLEITKMFIEEGLELEFPRDRTPEHDRMMFDMIMGGSRRHKFK